MYAQTGSVRIFLEHLQDFHRYHTYWRQNRHTDQTTVRKKSKENVSTYVSMDRLDVKIMLVYKAAEV